MAIFSFGNGVPMCLDAQVLVGGRHRPSPRALTNVFRAERYSDKSASGSVFLHDLRHGISLIQTSMSFAFRNQVQLCMCSCLRALDFLNHILFAPLCFRRRIRFTKYTRYMSSNNNSHDVYPTHRGKVQHHLPTALAI